MDKKQYTYIYNEIRNILLNDWDPSNVKDEEECQDEYDSYIWQIFRILLSSEKSEENLYLALKDIEENIMGLSVFNKNASDKHRKEVSNKLLKIII